MATARDLKGRVFFFFIATARHLKGRVFFSITICYTNKQECITVTEVDHMGGYFNIRSNIAQIVLIFILLPFLAIIFSVAFKNPPTAFADFLMNLIGQIPVCDIWVDILYKSASGLTQAKFIDMIPEAMMRAVPETMLLTVCVHATNLFSLKILRQHGLPIFSTMAGIILATFLASTAGLIENLIAELGVLVIMSIGIMLMFKAVLGSQGYSVFGIKRVIYIIIDGLLAVIACAYVGMLLIVFLGAYSSPGKALGSFFIISGLTMFAAILRYFASAGEDEDV